MTNKGIYTAVSGAIAQSQKLDTIANNIANVNTTAFKKDTQVFQEYLTAYEKQGDVIEVPKVPASIESFYDMQGGDRAYVDNAGTFVNFQQGDIRQTGNALDIGIEGRGFFEVLTASGVRLTRNGNFVLDSQGRLATKEGHLVLSSDANAPLEDRVIQFGPGGKIAVSANGEIRQQNELISTLSLVDVNDLQALKKMGSSLFALKENMNPQIIPAQNIKLHPGHLEASNVNAIEEMTDMIKTTRLFESTQKAIQAYDSMNRILANDVGKIE
tara:strand:- start:12636 stop:13448 length:813 start_codon:yes stop_codon:yes gene_type:complete